MQKTDYIPELTLANWRESEEWFMARQPEPEAAQRVASKMRIPVHPHTIFLPGAKEALAERHPDTTKSMLPNHVSDDDPIVVAVELARRKATQDLVDNAGVASKLDVYHIGDDLDELIENIINIKIKNKRIAEWLKKHRPDLGTYVKQRVIEVGTFPNYGDRELGIKLEDATPEQLELLKEAKDSGKRLTQHYMETRDANLLFLENTRGFEPETVQPFKKSYAYILNDFEGKRKVESYPWGICYGIGVNPRKFSWHWLRPTVVIGAPETRYSRDVTETTQLLHARTQECLDIAFDRAA